MCIAKQCRRISNVALRKESVDRNLIGCINRAIDIIVALRKESVDRNVDAQNLCVSIIQSLSARRAWIEIGALQNRGCCRWSLSARRAWIEMHIKIIGRLLVASLSARRAWIEMPLGPMMRRCGAVALRKESVDRNQGHPIIFVSF